MSTFNRENNLYSIIIHKQPQTFVVQYAEILNTTITKVINDDIAFNV